MNSDQIAENARKYMDYDMIQQHTDLPNFPQFRSSLLLAFLNKSSHSVHSDLFTLAASLMQIGLDTHDMVPGMSKQIKNRVNRSLQLKVLAGDYFSSRFYHLLSAGGHIGLIQQLSEAICEVNRLKMSMYVSMQQIKIASEEYIQQSAAIKSHVFSVFSGYMENVYRKIWQELLHGFSRCEVITQEIARNESTHDFRFGWTFWRILQLGTSAEKRQLIDDTADPLKIKSLMLKYNIAAQLRQMLESQLNLVHAKIRQIDSEKLIAELHQICEPFARFLSGPKVLEEI